MLRNLKAEMARANITASEIAKATGRSNRTVRDRLMGRTQFPIQDAIAVKEAFFPEMTLEYLFACTEQNGA